MGGTPDFLPRKKVAECTTLWKARWAFMVALCFLAKWVILGNRAFSENQKKTRKIRKKEEKKEQTRTIRSKIKKKTFGKTHVFQENTHICEENEGDQESNAHLHNAHTWTQDEKIWNNSKKTWRKHEKRTFSEIHSFLMKIHIFARKPRATGNAHPPKTRKKHTCQNDA